MDKQTETFIKKSQKLEKLLKGLTQSTDETHFTDALKNVAKNNAYINKNYGLIEDMYALRNVFSHRERGNFIANVNKTALDALESIIKNLETPPTVISKFKVDVYQADTNDFVSTVTKTMHEKVYTHVPVWDGNKFVGVFSYTSFFAWLVERQQEENREVTFTKKLMSDINRKYLNSPAVNYQFVRESKNLYEIPPLFEKAVAQRKRLDCLLITKNGRAGEEITGIVTSWDLGGIF